MNHNIWYRDGWRPLSEGLVWYWCDIYSMWLIRVRAWVGGCMVHADCSINGRLLLPAPWIWAVHWCCWRRGSCKGRKCEKCTGSRLTVRLSTWNTEHDTVTALLFYSDMIPAFFFSTDRRRLDTKTGASGSALSYGWYIMYVSACPTPTELSIQQKLKLDVTWDCCTASDQLLKWRHVHWVHIFWILKPFSACLHSQFRLWECPWLRLRSDIVRSWITSPGQTPHNAWYRR